MGLTAGFILFSGVCNWCGKGYQRQKPLEIYQEDYIGIDLSRDRDYINFCSRECYELYQKKKEIEGKNREREYWNEHLLGGYDEYLRCRCYLCHRDGNEEKVGLYKHHFTRDRNYVVRLCFSCHRKAHTDFEVDKYLRRELEAYFGVILGEPTPKWGRHARTSTI